MDKKKVDIYVSHTIKGVKAHKSAYGYVLETITREKHVATCKDFGAVEDFTAHELELYAIKEAFRRLTKPCDIYLYSDHGWFKSIYESKRIYEWRDAGWKKKDNTEVKNCELMAEILDFTESEGHSICAVGDSLGEYAYYLKWETGKLL